MPTRFDKKGKYYTEKVTKDKIKVTVRTLTDTLVGKLHIPPDKRLKDYLNDSSGFIALTNGAVLDDRGEAKSEFDFMAVQQHQIVWVIEEQAREPIPTPGGKI